VQPSDTTVPLSALWGSGPNDVFAAGEKGTIVHYDGTRWVVARVRLDNNLVY